MIRDSLPRVKAATFSIHLPSIHVGGHPAATGTGFFVSPDGWFVTATHVITTDGKPTDPVRTDLDRMMLRKPKESFGKPSAGCSGGFELVYSNPEIDIALLKTDFAVHSKRDWLEGKDGFPHINVSIRPLEEGDPVYSFGYPLSETRPLAYFPGLVVGPGVSASATMFSPRVTSAIVASTRQHYGPVMSSADPIRYVIDKALNYGNSGGPIISVDTGNVFALCSQFQPVLIPQSQLGSSVYIMIPSLYGVVSSLSNPPFVEVLNRYGVPVSDA